MTPTLALSHTRTTDDLAFVCQHNRRKAYLSDNETLAGMFNSLAKLMTAQGTECACWPAVVKETWPSMSEALAMLESALETGLTAKAFMVVGARDQYGDLVRWIEANGCQGCDPRLVITTTTRSGPADVERRVIHQNGCPAS
jgi:hypothetical protein